MNILQLSKQFPYPLHDGYSIAVTYMSKALAELGCELTLLSMNTSKHPFDARQLPASYSQYKAIHTVPIDNRIKPLDAFANLFSSKSYHVTRFISAAFADKLRQLLASQHFDVVQLETLYLTPYIPIIRQHSSAKIVLRAHNIEHEIWSRIAQHTRPLPKRWYLKHLARKLERYELSQFGLYDLLVAITDRDKAVFEQMGYQQRAIAAPIGIDMRDYMADEHSYHRPTLSMAFIGSLDWMPNYEGIEWFLRHIWPSLHRRFPALELHVAGRKMPDWMRQGQWPKVRMYGEVPDARAFMKQHSILLVPLLAGSGMRAKILEGMALGRSVLSTRIGLEGIDARHQSEVLVADTFAEFEAAIAYCYAQGGQLVRLGQRAQVFTARCYDNRVIAEQLIKEYRKLLGKDHKRGIGAPIAALRNPKQ